MTLATDRPFVVSVIYGPEKPQAKMWHRFRDEVESRLPGEYDIRIVTGGALGGEKETTEGIRLGSIQGALSTLANLSTWVPEGSLFDMPFIFRNEEHIANVMEGPVGARFSDLYQAQGFKVLGYVTYGARQVISKNGITAPDDVKGMTMRVIQSELHIDLWRFLGASPTAIPIVEAYNALKTGIVDYMDMTKSGFHALKLYEVVPVITETNHIWALGAMYLDQRWWDGLPQDHQQVFQSAADNAISYFNHLAREEQDAALASTLKAGARVIKPEIADWQQAMLPFWEQYADSVGGMKMIEMITDTP